MLRNVYYVFFLLFFFNSEQKPYEDVSEYIKQVIPVSYQMHNIFSTQGRFFCTFDPKHIEIVKREISSIFLKQHCGAGAASGARTVMHCSHRWLHAATTCTV
jgi:hypothetical protein